MGQARTRFLHSWPKSEPIAEVEFVKRRAFLKTEVFPVEEEVAAAL